jgi:hypothetical protein
MRDEQMIQITIPLDDDSAARLRELAQLRGESVEQTAQALLLATIPPATPTARPAPALPSDDPDGSQLILRMAGSITWPGVEGPVNTTNEEIDRLLGAEAMNPHEPT